MASLHNRVSQKELKERLYQETEPRITVSFYRYFPIADPRQFRDDLYFALHEKKVFGRIYVAREGINAQVSVPRSLFDDFRTCLEAFRSGIGPETRMQLNLKPPALPIMPPAEPPMMHPVEPPMKGIRLNIAVDDDGKSFWVLKIKVRHKIVADGIEDIGFDMSRNGKYVNAAEFNRLTDDPATIVVDMRNHYEYEVGHFENAIEIPSDTFREQLPMSVRMLEDKRDQTIIMYCTGGIRCEKASAWLLHKGFRNIFHLEGGIIHYANTVQQQGLENKFRGKNFVFDDRLGERIGGEVIAVCHQCGQPCDSHTNCRNEGCHLLFIQCPSCAAAYEGCCSSSCRDIVRLPEEEQRMLRKGADPGRRVFNKSRIRRG